MPAFEHPLGSVTFQIRPEDFVNYNFYVSKSINKKRARKNMLMGAAEAAVAVVYTVATLVMKPEKINWLFIALAAMLLVMGVFNMLFFPFIFPKKLQKAANKVYAKSQYLQNPITLNFYEQGFEERACSVEGDVPWGDCTSLVEEEDMFVISLPKNRCVIVPKAVVKQEDIACVRSAFAHARPLIAQK